MKKLLLVAFVLLLPSFALAWTSDFDVVVKELKQAIPSKYIYSGVMASDGHYTLVSNACADDEFVSTLRKKYAGPKAKRHLWKLAVRSLECEYDGDKAEIYKGL